METLTAYILIFAASLIFALGATPVMRRVALATGVVDQPSARKLHQRTVPLLGGAAIYGAAVLALALFGDRFFVSQLVGIFLGATLMSFLGLWDDRWHLPPLVKLVGQGVAAVILIITGVRVEFLPSPLLNIAVTILWVVGLTNALNLLDNMDGLSAGVAAVAAAFFLLLAAFKRAVSGRQSGGGAAWACLGFFTTTSTRPGFSWATPAASFSASSSRRSGSSCAFRQPRRSSPGWCR